MGKYSSYTEGDKVGSYTLGKELGDGRFGIVFAAIKNGDTTPQYAIKLPRHFSEAVESISDEIDVIRSLHGSPHVVQLHDVIEKSHKMKFMVMPKMESDMYSFLYSLSKEDRKIELPQAKSYIRQLLLGMDWMHSRHYLHGDMKPENLLIDTRTGHLRICDVGHAEHGTVWKDPPRTTQNYRALETILEMRPYTLRTDMWSVACIVYEIINNCMLFDPEFEETSVWGDTDDEFSDEDVMEEEEDTDNAEGGDCADEAEDADKGERHWSDDESDMSEHEQFETDINHLEQIFELFGMPPKNVRKNKRHFFNAKGCLKNRRYIEPSPLAEKLSRQNKDLTAQEKDAICDFITPMLRYSEKTRPSAAIVLKSPWLSQQ